MYNKTLQAVKDTGLPYILVDEALQNGNDFGEKYCNALEYCFDKGFEKIISVGTDCASLSTKILLDANSSSKLDNLIGADNNGGFYLFALHKKNYNRKCFSAFNWCTTQLLKDIFYYFKTNNLSSPALIQTKTDINSIVDLMKVVKLKKDSLFLQLLFQIFNKINFEITYCILKINSFSIGTLSLRGPPFINVVIS